LKIPEGKRNLSSSRQRLLGWRFLDYLEMRKIVYAIVAKLYPWIQIELAGFKYRNIGGGISVGEMRCTGIGWKAPRWIVIIPIPNTY
jgi:hypothetical protein